MLFVTPESTRVYLWLFAILRLGWTVNAVYSSETTELIRLRRLTPGEGSTSCLVPPQPINGQWKLHRESCDDDHDCAIPQGIRVQSGSHLVYRCDPDHRVEGNSEIYCKRGTWSDDPSCIKIKCRSLGSATRRMYWGSNTNRRTVEILREDILDDQPVNTVIHVACRQGYEPDDSIGAISTGPVTCSVNGTWQPRLLDCKQVCGINSILLYRLSTTPTTEVWRHRDSPWHASLYLSNGTRKNFICGATIIRPKILLTAGLCIYDEKTKTTIDTGKLFVMTGNTLVDYDSPMHDPEIVKKAAVKSIHVVDGFGAATAEFNDNLAMLELQVPFVLSLDLVPACLIRGFDGYGEDYKHGEYGTLVGFTRNSSNTNSDSLKNFTVPFVAWSSYTFTAGSTNGSGIYGSGIVFKKNNLWNLAGILTTGNQYSGNDDRYVQVNWYSRWIFNKIRTLETNNNISPPTATPTTTTPPSPTPAINSPNDGILASDEDSFCLVPPQPDNGEWRVHEYICVNNTECNVPQGTRLKPGSVLIYKCAIGYTANGNTDVYCGLNGRWSAIPSCIVLKCDALNSASTIASCSRFGEKISCDYPVPSETRAEIFCRKGYRKDTLFVANQRDTLSCAKNGKWRPEPIRCVPVCGIATTQQTPFVVGGSPAEIGDFPWHATLYKQSQSSKRSSMEFLCGATIIHTKFLLTAAHCVYTENNMTVADPATLFVVTGNIFRNYDSWAHDSQLVKKCEVKNVLVHSNYYGLQGNYASDIALIELQRPFEISETLLPACLDIDGSSERILEPGAYGKVAGFGRTATSASSGVLQTLTLPYVSYTECKNSINGEQNQKLISDGKFCAGYNNGSAVCEGDSGGGLVFLKNELWYVMGIVSVGLRADFNTGERTCDRYSYTLYTKVATYMDWIRDGILNSEQ